MTEWKTSLNCKKCGNELCPDNNLKNLSCKNCERSYIISIENIEYAVAESGDVIYYKFINNNTVEKRIFTNPPIDTLEEAYQDTIHIFNSSENRPEKLLAVVKNYHDALKMCGRRLLELYPGNLCQNEIKMIKVDPIGNKSLKGLNIKNLFFYLKKAYPSKSADIYKVKNAHIDMITRIWWVRNKLEHILYSQWPINAKIFQNSRNEPNCPDLAPDHLNYDFLKRVNHTTIDIYNFIITLRPTSLDQFQINTVEYFRINNNP